MSKYVFKKYNKNYPKLFAKEKSFLIGILPGVFGMEHIGSTAVYGLGGKGIIDILISFKKAKDIEFAKETLLNNNYELMSKHAERVSLRISRGFLFKNHFHIHLTKIGSKTWKDALKFRDKLRNNSGVLHAYTEVKKKAVVVAKGEGEIYRKLKEAFIRRHLK
jgi:GrpB-like predicted nucleotidyltransferase (UPF0157 family)